MRPWLLHIGPLFVPTEGRQEIQAISEVVGAEYVSHIWKEREAAKPQASKSICNWPAKFTPAKVTKLKVGARG